MGKSRGRRGVFIIFRDGWQWLFTCCTVRVSYHLPCQKPVAISDSAMGLSLTSTTRHIYPDMRRCTHDHFQDTSMDALPRDSWQVHMTLCTTTNVFAKLLTRFWVTWVCELEVLQNGMFKTCSSCIEWSSSTKCLVHYRSTDSRTQWLVLVVSVMLPHIPQKPSKIHIHPSNRYQIFALSSSFCI